MKTKDSLSPFHFVFFLELPISHGEIQKYAFMLMQAIAVIEAIGAEMGGVCKGYYERLQREVEVRRETF